MKNYFQVKNLCYAYLKKPLCLKDVNFSAEKNDKILILGLDDKGKSTLIKSISAFDEKYFGEVLLNGTELRKLPLKERSFSLIFDYPVLLNASIDDNLDYLYKILEKEIPKAEEKQGLLKKFNINNDLKCKVKKLTLFEQFKFCLLRVFIKKSRIIFIDDILKYKFQENELKELFEIIDLISKESLLFVCASDKSFIESVTFIEKFEWSKVLYLNNMNVYEKRNLLEFYEEPIDLDALKFNNGFETIDAYCIFQDGAYYVSINEEFIIKLDKKLYPSLEKMKLKNLENEDVVLAYKKRVNPDFAINNDINKMISKRDIIIFSKLDRSRIN